MHLWSSKNVWHGNTRFWSKQFNLVPRGKEALSLAGHHNIKTASSSSVCSLALDYLWTAQLRFLPYIVVQMSNSLGIIYCLRLSVVWSPFCFHQVKGERIFFIPSLLPSLHHVRQMKTTATHAEIRLNINYGLNCKMWYHVIYRCQAFFSPIAWKRALGTRFRAATINRDMWIIRHEGNCQLTASLSLSIWDDVKAKRQRWKYKGLGCDRGNKIRQSAIVHQFENSSIQRNRSVSRTGYVVRKNRIS